MIPNITQALGQREIQGRASKTTARWIKEKVCQNVEADFYKAKTKNLTAACDNFYVRGDTALTFNCDSRTVTMWNHYKEKAYWSFQVPHADTTWRIFHIASENCVVTPSNLNANEIHIFKPDVTFRCRAGKLKQSSLRVIADRIYCIAGNRLLCWDLEANLLKEWTFDIVETEEYYIEYNRMFFVFASKLLERDESEDLKIHCLDWLTDKVVEHNLGKNRRVSTLSLYKNRVYVGLGSDIAELRADKPEQPSMVNIPGEGTIQAISAKKNQIYVAHDVQNVIQLMEDNSFYRLLFCHIGGRTLFQKYGSAVYVKTVIERHRYWVGLYKFQNHRFLAGATRAGLRMEASFEDGLYVYKSFGHNTIELFFADYCCSNT